MRTNHKTHAATFACCLAALLTFASEPAGANRYYSPGLGRFISRDAVGYREGMNLYGYSQDNPTRLTDAFGEQISASPEDKVYRASDLPLTETERLHGLLRLDPQLEQIEVRQVSPTETVYHVPPFKPGSREYELSRLNNVLEDCRADAIKKLGGRISQGFVGNMLGWPKCTDIFEALHECMTEKMRKARYSYEHYEIVTIVQLPWEPVIGFGEHIYLGLRRKGTEEIIAFADPWRNLNKYGGWTPIAQDTYSRDEVRPWFMGYGPKKMQIPAAPPAMPKTRCGCIAEGMKKVGQATSPGMPPVGGMVGKRNRMQP
ncbi:hypothetical protein HYR99_22960 [Candidatus Poribacteria bacterium]|nr:hypothetical protein [Candidatus Poribacteria bacterium]